MVAAGTYTPVPLKPHPHDEGPSGGALREVQGGGMGGRMNSAPLDERGARQG